MVELFRRTDPTNSSVARQFSNRIITECLRSYHEKDDVSGMFGIIENLCEFEDFSEMFRSDQRFINLLLEWSLINDPCHLARLIEWKEIEEDSLVLLICERIYADPIKWLEATQCPLVVEIVSRRQDIITKVLKTVATEKNNDALLALYTWIIRVYDYEKVWIWIPKSLTF